MATTGGEEPKAGAAGCVDGDDLYAVLGLKKECSATDLRSAYKKLALRWHPDRCSASGSLKAVEDSKTKFQAIQEAYSVLSDTNKRLLYDVGVYDNDDCDDANGMGEFLGEMAAMMDQSKPHACGNTTFEELQELFVEMFQADMDADAAAGGGGGSTATVSSHAQRETHRCGRSTSTTSFAAPTYWFYNSGGGGGHKRDSEDMRTGKAKGVAVWDGAAGPGLSDSFCFGGQGPHFFSFWLSLFFFFFFFFWVLWGAGGMQAHEGRGSSAARERAAVGTKRRNGRKPAAA